MQGLTIYFPGKLVFGKNCLDNLPQDILQLHPSKVVIITIQPLLTILETFTEKLVSNGVAVETDTSITREPSFSDFSALMESVASFNPDVVVGIGGGSVLDVAKLVAAQLENDQRLEEIVGIGFLKSRSKKLICVPATAGTGSEASPNAILVDDADNQKKGIISPFLVPDVVYVDPMLTLSVPPEITAATGLDALTHCLEAYTNKFAHPFIDLYAFEGMRLIAGSLVKAVTDGGDEEARADVAMGSLLGGICFGPVNTAAVHALSYPLGSEFHLAHGLPNALLLPYVMEFNAPASPQKYARAALALGCPPAENDEQTAALGVAKVRELVGLCGIPSRLRDVGIPENAIPAMAADALKITRLLKNNPREVTLEDAVAIYKAAY